MKILVDQSWKEGVLDETVYPSTVRIQVLAWFRHRKVRGVFFERTASIGRLIGYLKKAGPRDVIRKVISRRSERDRNTRFLCTGIGKVVSVGDGAVFNEGDIVSFVAPNHPAAMSRVVLDARFVRAAKLGTVPQSFTDQEERLEGVETELDAVEGWHRESGLPVGADSVDRLCGLAVGIGTLESSSSKPSGREEIRTRSAMTAANENATKPVASLFGYGNYAKSVILPSVSSLVEVTHIHEIEPLQMGNTSAVVWDTSSRFASDEQPEICFVAGFHHTHAETAVEALKRGVKTLIEKPAITTWEQLEQLRAAVKEYQTEAFVGFHRRYMKFNQMLLEDLEIKSGDPVNYHCIVFEEPLPRHHWYRWPNSRTRLTSNGCHWIDHFLFLNGYPKVIKGSVTRLSRGAEVVVLETENGAGFSMTLTDEGSARLGVQDHVECRFEGKTATIISGIKYVAENESRVIRRASESYLDSRRNMYKSVVKKMLGGEPGEAEALFAAAEICLQLEEDGFVRGCGCGVKG